MELLFFKRSYYLGFRVILGYIGIMRVSLLHNSSCYHAVAYSLLIHYCYRGVAAVTLSYSTITNIDYYYYFNSYVLYYYDYYYYCFYYYAYNYGYHYYYYYCCSAISKATVKRQNPDSNQQTPTWSPCANPCVP